MWGIPAFIFLFAFLHRVAPGVVAKDIMRAFDIGGAAIGQLSAMYFYAYAGFMIPAGLLLDSFGVRRVYTAGAAVMGLGSLAMGLAGGQAALFGAVPLAALVVATSWRGAFSIIGVVTLLGALACLVFVRDHPRGHVEASAPAPSLRAVLHGLIQVFRNRHTW